MIVGFCGLGPKSLWVLKGLHLASFSSQDFVHYDNDW